jgi:glycosidase
MMTRSFGNQQTRNKPWGTIAENGVGKFSGINNAALTELRQMGISHIWYTGVLHHAVVADYSKYGISPDDPEVVKGRAGSPYAIKDYYNVNPDLADDPARRLAEFKALIQRTHAHGMKVIIDIVPNHVARHYQSTNLPADEMNLGANDNIYVEYARDNNFYYIPDQPFTLPKWPSDYKVLGGESHPMIDGSFAELPAKWTGNGSRQAQPTFDDWYETVKLNFGVRPDGTADFTRLPANYENLDNAAHWQFWQQQQVPDTWQKFRAISEFWLAQGVDGFRYDMAEMVPVEFWSYLNSHIKQQRPDALLIAEVYNPLEYRNYLKLGRMDTLYDKVDFYDTLKAIMQNKSPTSELLSKQAQVSDIESSMLHFLENHDEQRIASPEFVGDAHHGKPAMLVSTTISSSPILLYFGQEVGETGALDCGFGKPSRTTIFDYCGVPAHQRWMNDGAFDGGALSAEARSLRDFYSRLLRFSAGASALRGAYQPLNTTPGYSEPGSATIAFARWSGDQQLLVLAELQKRNITPLVLTLPAELISAWGLADGPHILKEQLYGQRDLQLEVSAGIGRIHTELQALDAMIFAVQRQ